MRISSLSCLYFCKGYRQNWRDTNAEKLSIFLKEYVIDLKTFHSMLQARVPSTWRPRWRARAVWRSCATSWRWTTTITPSSLCPRRWASTLSLSSTRTCTSLVGQLTIIMMIVLTLLMIIIWHGGPSQIGGFPPKLVADFPNWLEDPLKLILKHQAQRLTLIIL